jgi:hypothetical protein
MDKINFIEVAHPISGEVTEHAIIEHEDGSFTSMPKAHYDELKANEAKTL